MEVIGFNGTVITSLFNLAFRERGATPAVETAKEVVDRYKFVRPPKLEALFSDKIVFENGAYEGTAIDSLEVYPDGVIVRGRCDSEILDAFLQDVTGWYAEKTGARRIETRRVNKAYESNLVVVGSDKMLSALSPLKGVCEAISSALESATGTTFEFVPFGIGFSSDDATYGGLRQIPFRLERKVDSEFERNYFVSSAPLRTQDHVKVLQALER